MNAHAADGMAAAMLRPSQTRLQRKLHLVNQLQRERDLWQAREAVLLAEIAKIDAEVVRADRRGSVG